MHVESGMGCKQGFLRLATVGSVALGLVGSPASGSGDGFLPLAVGNWWEYEWPHGEYELQRIDRVDEIWGEDWYVRLFDSSPWSEGIEQYLREAEDGGLLIRGFWWEAESLGVLVDPPVRFVDPPLYKGKSWTTWAEMYELPDTTSMGIFEFTYHVWEEGTVVVPAGEFYAYGIAPGSPGVVTGGDGRTRDVRGLPVNGGSPPGGTAYYSEDVGEVQYYVHAVGYIQLTGYGLPVSTRSVTWGVVKAAFRNGTRAAGR